jgi:RNA polymerase sigma-70 factor (ECF subfamily)
MSGSEALLLARCISFDDKALSEAYDRFSPALYRYAWRLTGDDSTAEECVAETFGRFLAALRAGAGPNRNLQAYLYRVAHNWITDRWRRWPNELTHDDLEHNASPLAVDAEAEWTIGQQRVRKALRHLTPDQRQVIMLKFYEGFDNQQVAEATGKPVGAVKSLQHRALEALGRVLGREED